MLWDLRLFIAVLNIKITVLLHVTTCTLVNKFPSFLGNVLPLASRSKMNVAGSYERWCQTACVTLHNRAILSLLCCILLRAPFSSVAQQPNSGLGRHIVEVCDRARARARTRTHTHTCARAVALLWTSDQLVAEAATLATRNKTNRLTYMSSAG